jgi:hypothetical protein
MKALTASLALTTIAMMATGCDVPVSPDDRTGEYGKTVPQQIDRGPRPIDLPHPETVDPAIELTSPQFRIRTRRPGYYRFLLVASAGGTSTSPGVVALRSLKSVTFQVYGRGGLLLDSRMTTEIPTSGIMNARTHEVSLIATAGVDWNGVPEIGSYVVMTLRSDRGVFVRQESFPEDYVTKTQPATAYGPITIPRSGSYCPACSSIREADAREARSRRSNR